MKTRTKLLLLLATLSLACSGTHTSSDAGPRADAGPLPGDGGGPRRDAGPPVDAGPRADAGSPIADAGFVGACAPRRVGEAAAEGCFCSGPIVRYGDVLYRQSLGVEVFDLSVPDQPRLVRIVEERAGSEGGLAIVRGHLVSVANFAPLHVYDLADPLDPQRVATLELEPSPFALAVSEDIAAVAVARNDGTRALLRIDLSDPTQPRLRGETALGDQDWGPITADAGRAFIAETRIPDGGGDAVYEVREISLTTGLSQLHPFESRGALLAAHGLLYVAGLDMVLRVLEPRGDALVELGRHSIAGEYPSAIGARGARLVVASQTLSVFDVSDPSQPRLAGESEEQPSASWVESSATHAYLSNGGRLDVWALDCE